MKMPKLSIVETPLDECVDSLDRFSEIRSAIFAVHSRIVAQSESRYNLRMARTAAQLLEEVRQLPPWGVRLAHGGTVAGGRRFERGAG
jgi:hypothetical protein